MQNRQEVVFTWYWSNFVEWVQRSNKSCIVWPEEPWEDSSGLCWSNKLTGTSAHVILCLCVHTRAGVCLCATPYVRELGSGDPEYTRWNVKCVFWAAWGQGMSSRFTVTSISGPTRVWVLWQQVMGAGSWGVRLKAYWSPHTVIYTKTD